MKGIVSTKRIYLRHIESKDIDNGWLSWINNPRINKFLNNTKYTSYEDLVKYLEKSKPPNVYMFAVCLLDNDEYIGNARLYSVDWINRQAKYGRLIGNEDIQSKGVGAEIITLLSYYAFYIIKLNRIYTGVIDTNISSIKSNEKAGAVKEGVARESAYIDGIYKDTIQFGITRKDFDKSEWKRIILK